MRRRAYLLVVLVGGLPARAQDATPGGGSLDLVADDVAGKAAAALARVDLAGAADLAVSVRPRGDAGQVPSLLEGLLLQRLRSRAGARSVDRLAAGGAEAASWAGFEVWLDVEVGVDGAHLVVTHRLVATDRNPWHPWPAADVVVATGHGRTRLDADLRFYLSARPPPRNAAAGPTPAPATATATAPAPARTKGRGRLAATRLPFETPGPVLALGAGDVDADGTVEVVALTPDHVVLFALRPGVLVEEQRFALDGGAPVPRSRIAVGTLVVADLGGDATPEILAMSSDHAAGIRLGIAQKGGPVTRLGTTTTFPVMVGRDPSQTVHLTTATLLPGTHHFGKAGVTTVPGRPGTAPALPDKMVALDGAGVLLAAVDPDGLLRLWRLGQKNPWQQLLGVGSAVEVANLDADAYAELITSSALPLGFGDVLLVRTLLNDGTAKTVHKETIKDGRIEAIAAGDLDGDGVLELAVSVHENEGKRRELWLLH